MATAPLHPRDLLKTASDLIQAGRFAEAAELLERVPNTEPTAYSQALALMGRCRARMGEFEHALQVLDFSLRIRPIAQTRYYLGECLYLMEDYERGVEELEEAVRLDDKLTDAFILLGNMRRAMGQPEEAIKAYNRALRNDPKAIAARFQLAQTAYDVGDLQRATTQAYTIVMQDDAYAPIHMLLGHCALRLQDFRQAAYEYCRTLELQPPSLEVYEGLGRAFANLKDYPQALLAFEGILYFNPDHEMACVAGARLAERLGLEAKAARLWTRALQFPSYEQLAREALEKLGADPSEDEPLSAPPLEFEAPPHHEKAIPRRGATAPLAQDGKTRELTSRATQPLPAPKPQPQGGLEGLLNPYVEKVAGWFGRLGQQGSGESLGETLGEMIARRMKDR